MCVMECWFRVVLVGCEKEGLVYEFFFPVGT